MKDLLYQAIVNDKREIEIEASHLSDLQLHPLSDKNTFHLLHDKQSVKVKILEADTQQAIYKLLLNGHPVRVQLKDKLQLMVEDLGLAVASSQKVSDIKAPMPGLVLQILVDAGDSVEAGDALLVLEAMKMENVIKASHSGTVERIEVSAGQAVEKNQLLLVVD